jgi:hypothetical protein
MSEAHKKALTKINKLNAGLKSVKRELAVKTNQLKASQAIIKEAHDKLVNVNAVSWEETAWEVKELLKIKEPKS